MGHTHQIAIGKWGFLAAFLLRDEGPHLRGDIFCMFV